MMPLLSTRKPCVRSIICRSAMRWTPGVVGTGELPARVTVWVGVASVSVTVTLAETGPCIVGVYTTVKVQLAPGSRVRPEQRFDEMAKWRAGALVSTMDVRAGWVPPAVMVTVFGWLDCPNAMAPKSRAVGVIDIGPAGGVVIGGDAADGTLVSAAVFLAATHHA